MLLLASRQAPAAPPAGLDYRAPPGCPEADSFVAAVEARGASLAPARDGSPLRLLVQIEAQPSGFAGSVQVQAEGEASSPRRVHAASCAEVGDALAVVTAIALQREPERSALPLAAPPAAAVAAAVPAASAATPPAPSGPLQLVMERESLRVPPGELVLDFISTYNLVGGVQLNAVPGLVLPRLDFSFSRTNLIITPDARAIVHGNEFRVRWTLLGLVTRQAPDFDTNLWGLKAGIGGCTPLSYNPDGLALKACSEIAAGTMQLETRAADGTKTQEKTQALATASIELDGQYNLSRLMHLDLRAGMEVWPSRISAERPDGSRLFQTRLLSGYATFGVGIHF